MYFVFTCLQATRAAINHKVNQSIQNEPEGCKRYYCSNKHRTSYRERVKGRGQLMANMIDYSYLNWLRSGEKSQLFQTLRIWGVFLKEKEKQAVFGRTG